MRFARAPRSGDRATAAFSASVNAVSAIRIPVSSKKTCFSNEKGAKFSCLHRKDTKMWILNS